MWQPSAPMGAEGWFHHSFCPPIYFQCKITMQNVHMTAKDTSRMRHTEVPGLLKSNRTNRLLFSY